MHRLTKIEASSRETRISTRACVDLRKFEGVRNCGSHIGQRSSPIDLELLRGPLLAPDPHVGDGEDAQQALADLPGGDRRVRVAVMRSR